MASGGRENKSGGSGYAAREEKKGGRAMAAHEIKHYPVQYLAIRGSTLKTIPEAAENNTQTPSFLPSFIPHYFLSRLADSPETAAFNLISLFFIICSGSLVLLLILNIFKGLGRPTPRHHGFARGYE